MRFQSPRGDFGFLKPQVAGQAEVIETGWVSIPSRGFWFFEVGENAILVIAEDARFQSPRGDFGFLKSFDAALRPSLEYNLFQSPRGDFGFLKPNRFP